MKTRKFNAFSAVLSGVKELGYGREAREERERHGRSRYCSRRIPSLTGPAGRLSSASRGRYRILIGATRKPSFETSLPSSALRSVVSSRSARTTCATSCGGPSGDRERGLGFTSVSRAPALEFIAERRTRPARRCGSRPAPGLAAARGTKTISSSGRERRRIGRFATTSPATSTTT